MTGGKNLWKDTQWKLLKALVTVCKLPWHYNYKIVKCFYRLMFSVNTLSNEQLLWQSLQDIPQEWKETIQFNPLCMQPPVLFSAQEGYFFPKKTQSSCSTVCIVLLFAMFNAWVALNIQTPVMQDCCSNNFFTVNPLIHAATCTVLLVTVRTWGLNKTCTNQFDVNHLCVCVRVHALSVFYSSKCGKVSQHVNTCNLKKECKCKI